MIIKVKDSGNRWVMFDNAELIKYDTTPVTFVSNSELNYLVPDDGITQVTFVLPGIDRDQISDANPLKVCIMNFTKLAKPYMIVFSTLVYICNDQGKTVEKVVCSEDRDDSGIRRYTDDKKGK